MNEYVLSQHPVPKIDYINAFAIFSSSNCLSTSKTVGLCILLEKAMYFCERYIHARNLVVDVTLDLTNTFIFLFVECVHIL